MAVVQDEKIIQKFFNASRVAALTGAGISAESGIPTFRGENGLWKELAPEELASFDAFYSNPAIVSEWYQHRRTIIQNSSPNPAHHALFELSGLFPQFDIITQNVDGLHQRAGCQNVIELHGSIMRNYCIRCGYRYTVEEFDDIYESSFNHVPLCHCGGYIRPDVVWFGEPLPTDQLDTAVYTASNADIFIIIGTSARVQPASELPILAKSKGAFLVEINPNRTVMTDSVDLSIRGAAGIVLPKLVEQLRSKVYLS
jgi:NAD-dependent deacetylase